jgi:hypothetical protein
VQSVSLRPCPLTQDSGGSGSRQRFRLGWRQRGPRAKRRWRRGSLVILLPVNQAGEGDDSAPALAPPPRHRLVSAEFQGTTYPETHMFLNTVGEVSLLPQALVAGQIPRCRAIELSLVCLKRFTAMPRSQLLHRFGLPPSRSRVKKLGRGFSPRRNCNTASRPTFSPLSTKPNGRSTVVTKPRQLICGDTQEVLETIPSRLPKSTPSSFSLALCAFPINDASLSTNVQQPINNRPAGCGLYEPRRLDFPSVGNFVGTLTPSRGPARRKALILLGFEAMAVDAPDVKLDFQQAVMIVKHNHKGMFCWAFRSLNIKAIRVQTTGSPSNHCVCGEARGDQKEGSNG